MKKISALLLIVFLFVFVSCKNDDKENKENKEQTTDVKDEKSEIQVKVEEVTKKQMISMRTEMEMSQISTEFARMYGELMKYVEENSYKIVAPPVAIYHSWSYSINDVEVGLIVEGDLKGTDNIIVSETYEGKVVTAIHFGAYDKVHKSWMAIDDYIKANKLEENGAAWEEYITDTALEQDTSKWQTKLYMPVK